MVRITNMEHAVPQNITSFQFRLVGDMTLKQFGYLAAGMVIAYIAFVTILPTSPVIGIPIIGLSSLLGAAFAFFPIADRPLDHWVLAFFRAIHSPTQASWKSTLNYGKNFNPQDPAFKNRLGTYLSSLGVNTPIPTPPPPPQENRQEQITRIKPESPAVNTQTETTLIQQMGEYIKQLQTKVANSERQLQELRSSATIPQPSVAPPPPIQTPPPTPPIVNPQVKIVEPSRPAPTQVTLTSSPNVINGIVIDTAGNYLEGVIVSIHDKDGLPVRALKTNKLGQFAGATPLAAGTYTVTFEKDSLEFETLQVELDGSVLSPVNVRAKKGGI